MDEDNKNFWHVDTSKLIFCDTCGKVGRIRGKTEETQYKACEVHTQEQDFELLEVI